jgi:hypothetical protein
MRSYLKKVSWLLLLFTVFQPLVAGSDRKTDVYYSNGIYTVYHSRKCSDEMSAQCSRDRLYKKLKDENFTDTNISMLDKSIVDEAVILQYNWSQRQRCEDRKDKSHFCADKDAVMGYDLLETYYQLKTSGQIDRALGFFGWLATLVIDTVQAVASIPGIVPSEEEIARIERANVDKMIAKYKQESVNEHNDILLISHSQGNLFANRVYDVYFSTDPGGEDHYKYRFANIQVASPADYVHAFTHDYITREDDKVMSWVPGSLDPNVDGDQLYDDICQYDHGNNHAFVKAYLECPIIPQEIRQPKKC